MVTYWLTVSSFLSHVLRNAKASQNRKGIEMDDSEYDYRDIPIWALLQIQNIQKRIKGVTVLDFINAIAFIGTPLAWGTLVLRIEGEGTYDSSLKKAWMNDKTIPNMYWNGD